MLLVGFEPTSSTEQQDFESASSSSSGTVTYGAGYRGRTGTNCNSSVFKTEASAYSANPANLKKRIYKLIHTTHKFDTISM